MLDNDTIVALATAHGVAGLAVVRVSGPDAVAVADRVFHTAEWVVPPVSHRAVYGILKSPTIGETTDYQAIDEVLCLPLLAPRSYTGEDTVEFFCHGGRAVSRLVVAACRQAGARPATPGEFTRRAFMNGKLSLDRAEAVADLIHAEGRHAARAAIGQLLGGLDRQLTSIEQPLLSLLSEIEGSLEFSEDEDMSVDPVRVHGILTEAVEKITELLALAPAGRLLRDGVQVVLAGPPNVGKSSLFNRLVQEDRALVDDEAGTTRDVVSAVVEHRGVRFEFHDTAGLRQDAGRVESMGMDRTRRSLNEADIVLHLQEASHLPLDAACGNGHDALAGTAHGQADGAVVIRVGTKADQDIAASEGYDVLTSALDGRGLPALWDTLHQQLEGSGLRQAVGMGVVLNERHQHKLQVCREELSLLLDQLAVGDPGGEVVGTMLSSILGQFGEISGRVFSEHLLESIFSRFCVGK